VAAAAGAHRIDLSWQPATDDTGVAGYGVYRDGGATPIATTSGAAATSFTDTGLAAGSTHTYEVDAVDAAGNRSLRSAPAGATTAASGPVFFEVPVEADSYVRSDQPAANFGDATLLRADSSPVMRSYLRFDLEGVEGAEEVSAILRISARSTRSLGYQVRGVASNSWGEGTITFNNAPSVGAVVGSSGPIVDGEWSEVDVSSLIDGDGPLSLAVTNTSATAISLSSREAGAALRPHLVIMVGSDEAPPSVPTGLAATVHGPRLVSLAWSPSTDDVGVAGYAVYRDGVEIGATSGAGATSFTDSGLAPGSTHAYAVDAVDAAGNRSARSAEVMATTDPPRADPVIAAAGDIACDPTSASFSLTGNSTSCRMMATSDLLIEIGPDAVLPLGDLQYENGAPAKWAGSYHPTWGRVKGITHPVPGNHDYETAGAAGYYQYFGAAAGDPAKGYYSYDLGAWHLVALNSECTKIAGGCGPGSPQAQFLQADLAAHPAACTLAYWHRPRFASGNDHGDDPTYDAFWQILHAAGADVVLVGHAHHYERYAPQSPAGALDLATGIREFVVGTGGRSFQGLGTIGANSQVRSDDTFGVLKLTLRSTGYDWEFVAEPGAGFSDSGTASCH
jgi:chitodextrinase